MAPPLASAVAPLVFRGVTVIDVRDGQRLADQTVVIVGRRIQSIEPTGRAQLPRGAQVVDASGQYLIPGLWDVRYRIFTADHSYPRLIANGITGFRSPHLLGGEDIEQTRSMVQTWQREVTTGARVGPRQPQAVWFPGLRHLVVRTTPQETQRVIDSVQEAGVKYLKIFPSGMGGDAYGPDVYFAILSAARRNGLHVMGNPPPNGVTLAQAADSGQRTFENIMLLYKGLHVQGICSGASASVATCRTEAQALRRRNAWITPAISVFWHSQLPGLSWPRHPKDAGRPPSIQSYDSALSQLEPWKGNERFLPWMRELLPMLQQAEMPLLAGSGSDNEPWLVHEELAMFVALGMSPLGALQTATLNPAIYLNAADSLGTVAAGKLADLVLLNADPLTDVTNTAAIVAVVADGRYYDRAALDRLLTYLATESK